MAQLPPWSPLAGVTAPPSDGSGRIVALLASEDGVAAGWAPSAALELARSWSGAGRRVILIDAALEGPSLHEAAQVENREGLSDAVLYGVSVARVSRAVGDAGLFLVTAGAPVGDGQSVVGSPRWHRLAEGMTDAGVLVLLYLRAGGATTTAFLGSASDVVVLAAPDDPKPASVRDLAPLVRAVTSPDGAVSSSSSAADGAPPVVRSAPSRARRSAVSPLSWEGGVGRTVLLVIGALLAAAGLGYLLTSLL